MFERTVEFLRGVKGKMLGRKAVEKMLQIEVLQSPQMSSAIKLWEQVYLNKPDWVGSEVKGRNMGAAIASEMARLVMTDFAVNFEGDDRAGTINSVWKDVLSPNIRTYTEYAIALGGGIFKPFMDDTGIIGVDFVKAGNFYPTHFTPAGDISGAIFPTERIKGKDVYYLIEYQYLQGDTLIIENKAYKATSFLGDMNLKEIPLSTLEEWSSLEPIIHIENMERPLFSYFRMPLANNIDLNSPLGASVYSRAIPMLEDLDRLYTNYNWEFESGKRAIYVDTNAFAVDEKTGERLIPDKRLYRTMRRMSVDGSINLFEDFTPEFREQALSNGMNNLMMAIEDACGLARGTYSLLTFATAKTATELKISLQRSFHTVVDVQNALEMSLMQLFNAVDILATLYGVDGGGTYTALYTFGDSVLDDPDKMFQQQMQMMTAGIIEPWEFYMWYFKVDEETAREHSSGFSEVLFGGDG